MTPKIRFQVSRRGTSVFVATALDEDFELVASSMAALRRKLRAEVNRRFGGAEVALLVGEARPPVRRSSPPQR